MASGLFKKIVSGVLVGGGTILSALCPPAGIGMMSVGATIGAGAQALGGVIGSKSPTGTIDNSVATLNNALSNAGLLQPAQVNTPSVYNQQSGITTSFNIGTWLPIVAIGAVLLLLFRKKRR